jgi:multiple sugar transport system substrate-binding protein
MGKTKRWLSVIGIALSAVSLSGCGFKTTTPASYSIDLEVWGVFDDSDAYTQVFAEYKKINPYVRNITYRKLDANTYKEDLLNALAAGNGPDIFMIRNSWRGSFQDKSAPAPDTMITEQAYRSALVDVAADDFIGSDGKIYGIPLSVDSLALYYNKDLFNAAGITQPPTTWDELAEDAKRLTRIDQSGNITQSGVAMGTAYNINRSTDILTALMFQKGSNIIEKNQSGRVNFTDDQSRSAFDFYTQFAHAGSGYYVWNPQLHYSIDAFYEGTVGMMINYSWQYATIKQKNAKLNIGIAALPQFDSLHAKNVANYWGYAVSKSKSYPSDSSAQTASGINVTAWNAARTHEAWQLLKFMGLPIQNNSVTLQNAIAGTTKTFTVSVDPTELYLAQTGKPAARRDLIDKEKSDIVFGPFVTGNLIAENWYQGNTEAMESAMAEMIDSVNTGAKNTYDALSTAVNRINVLK